MTATRLRRGAWSGRLLSTSRDFRLQRQKVTALSSSRQALQLVGEGATFSRSRVATDLGRTSTATVTVTKCN
jgi:hypothetical protein